MGELEDNLDQWFKIMFGMCILLMQCGFAFLEAGSVRSKNVTNILLKNVFDAYISGISYWLFGYAFAFGVGNDFIGHSNFGSYDLPDKEYANFFFQFTFAATAVTIVSGAVAERCEFIAYFVYSVFLTGFSYPVVTHWVWGGGFLSKGMDYGEGIGVVGFQDFAGSAVVHVLGGVTAFIGAKMLGPRIGRFHKETRQSIQLRGHSVPITALGGFMLFFGFLAFNGGSQFSIQNPGDGAAVSRAVVNTIISASFAAFVAIGINRTSYFGNGSLSLLVTINGALTGMVAICAGCNDMYPWGASVVGLLAGAVYHLVSSLMCRLQVDDPLDAVAVHLGGGILGVIAQAFFNRTDGIFLHFDRRSGLRLAWQLAGLFTIIGWTSITSLIVFAILKFFKVLRVSEEVEVKGLDIPKHKEPAYPVEAYGHGHVEGIKQIMAEVQRVKDMKGNINIGLTMEMVEDAGNYESPEVYSHSRKSSYSSDLSSPQLTERSDVISSGVATQNGDHACHL